MGAFDRLKVDEKRGCWIQKRKLSDSVRKFLLYHALKKSLYVVSDGMRRSGEHEFFNLFDLSAEGFVGIE